MCVSWALSEMTDTPPLVGLIPVAPHPPGKVSLLARHVPPKDPPISFAARPVPIAHHKYISVDAYDVLMKQKEELSGKLQQVQIAISKTDTYIKMDTSKTVMWANALIKDGIAGDDHGASGFPTELYTSICKHVTVLQYKAFDAWGRACVSWRGYQYKGKQVYVWHDVNTRESGICNALGGRWSEVPRCERYTGAPEWAWPAIRALWVEVRSNAPIV